MLLKEYANGRRRPNSGRYELPYSRLNMGMELRSSTEISSENCSSSARPEQHSTRTPHRTTVILLLAIILGLCDRNYWQYSNVDHYWPTYWMPFIHGTALAPEQYRIGVKLAAWWLVQHFHWGFRHGYALMDVVASVPGSLLLFDMVERKRWYRDSRLELQWFASAAFLMLVCFNLMWIESYFRPETLPTTGLVALMAWLWTRRGDAPPSLSRELLIIVGLLAASLAQGFIRADVVCMLSAGIFFVSVFAWGRGISLRRSAAIATSVACGLIGVGIQLYLMKIRYPQATYGPIPVWMIRYALRQPLNFPPFLCFIAPFAWTVIRFFRRPPPADAANQGILVGSVLYFALWVVMGKLDEVRIFVPFALALAPLTIELMIRRIGNPERAGVQA